MATQARPTCNCKELRYINKHGETVFVAPTKYHDCEYVAQRNSVVTRAERETKLILDQLEAEGKTRPWNEVFLETVDRMVRDTFGEKKVE